MASLGPLFANPESPISIQHSSCPHLKGAQKDLTLDRWVFLLCVKHVTRCYILFHYVRSHCSAFLSALLCFRRSFLAGLIHFRYCFMTGKSWGRSTRRATVCEKEQDVVHRVQRENERWCTVRFWRARWKGECLRPEAKKQNRKLLLELVPCFPGFPKLRLWNVRYRCGTTNLVYGLACLVLFVRLWK